VTVEDRILRRVRVHPLGCWEWQGATNSQGQAIVQHEGKARGAARLLWECWFGPMPAGRIACHHCDNQGCVNPLHLYAGTYSDNNRDTIRRDGRKADHLGRYRRAAQDVRAGHTQVDAARRHGISRKVLRSVLRGTHWSVREG
jgi:hypothetical protein